MCMLFRWRKVTENGNGNMRSSSMYVRKFLRFDILKFTEKSPYGVVEYKRVLVIGTALIALSAEFPTLHCSLICYKNTFLCNPPF